MKAAQHWSELDNARRSLLTRWEKYSAFTIARICLPQNFNERNTEMKHDWQAVGAQAVNHVVNKLMLTLFAPSRPFMRLELSAEARQEMSGQVPDSLIDDILADGERKAVRVMDSRGDIRPRMHLALTNLVVTGNACIKFPEKKDEQFRCFYSRDWACQRTAAGDLKRLVIRECYLLGELEPDVQSAYRTHVQARDDSKVTLYTVILRNAKGGYVLEQYVDDFYLGKEFSGSYKDYDSLPYKVITWSLADNADYGTGLVEDYAGDYAALSAMSEAQVKGAILACEFRWLVNPAGFTKPEDLANSQNGEALPGVKDDITPLSADQGNNLSVVQAVSGEYIQRIGRGFLLSTAVTRDAERVTAEEIRMQANELETSLGGAYTRIAVELQKPLAVWLLDYLDIKIDGREIDLSIVTGLDALSRSGDLDALRAALADVNAVNNLPPQAQATLNLEAIYATIFNGHGLPGAKFVKSAQEVAENQAAQQQQETQQVVNAEAAKAGAQAAVQ